MCLIGIALHHFDDYPVVIVANRDEFHDRPTAPLHQWPDMPAIFAGRDEQAGGTWLGVSRTGRIAALTNVRGGAPLTGETPSRGQLVTDFLNSTLSTDEWLQQIAPTAQHFAGFNLLLHDSRSRFSLFSNSGHQRQIDIGVHSLSNGALDAGWPKERRLKQALSALDNANNVERLREVIEDRIQAVDEDLPNTGVGLALERQLAPQLIVGDTYGTRSTAVLRVDLRGDIDFREYTRDREGRMTNQIAMKISPSANG